MRKISLVGMEFGRLCVTRESPDRKNGKVYWECVCKCGNDALIAGSSLRTGLSKSCGCGVKDSNISRSIHGMTKSPEHKAWRQILARCDNKSNPGYKDYGGRGISVCERWRYSFLNFFEDMGRRPSSGHSIDRKDTNGNYEPDNCWWATRTDQNENTRASKLWVVEGLEFPSSSKAAAHFCVSQATIVRWCNGYKVNGEEIAPRSSCSSFLKYEELP